MYIHRLLYVQAHLGKKRNSNERKSYMIKPDSYSFKRFGCEYQFHEKKSIRESGFFSRKIHRKWNICIK